MKRSVAIILTFQLLMLSGTAAWAEPGQVQSNGHPKQYATELKPDKKYRVRFLNGSSVKVPGRDLILTEQYVGIRQAEAGTFLYYDRSQFKDVTRGSHWAIGMGIGAGAGALAGSLGGYFGGSCSGSSEPSDCDSLDSVGAILFGIVGAVAGGGIGAGIGAAIPKKVKITVSPTVMSAPGRPIAGGGLGIAGKF